jgi:hypothetical protein
MRRAARRALRPQPMIASVTMALEIEFVVEEAGRRRDVNAKPRPWRSIAEDSSIIFIWS